MQVRRPKGVSCDCQMFVSRAARASVAARLENPRTHASTYRQKDSENSMNLLNWFADSNYLKTGTETLTGSEIGTIT